MSKKGESRRGPEKKVVAFLSLAAIGLAAGSQACDGAQSKSSQRGKTTSATPWYDGESIAVPEYGVGIDHHRMKYRKLEGRILDSSGDAATGIYVQIGGGLPRQFITRTSEDGKFSISVPSGFIEDEGVWLVAGQDLCPERHRVNIKGQNEETGSSILQDVTLTGVCVPWFKS